MLFITKCNGIHLKTRVEIINKLCFITIYMQCNITPIYLSSLVVVVVVVVLLFYVHGKYLRSCRDG